MDTLNIATAGNIDDGKSTLIGRMMLDSKVIMEDQLAVIALASQVQGDAVLNLALFTDGLKDEQSQGITIDVAYRYFSTPNRRFVLADSPGHLEFTRNMITAASNAEVMLLVIDASRGPSNQTRRHLLIASLLGLQEVIVCVNKMDLVAYSQKKFRNISESLLEVSGDLSTPPLSFIPISALNGDNIVNPSTKMPWYRGPPIFKTIEKINSRKHKTLESLRIGFQWTPESPERRVLATVLAGSVKLNDILLALPSRKSYKVKGIDTWDRDLSYAQAPQAIGLRLSEIAKFKRGDLLVRAHEEPPKVTHFKAVLFWMALVPLEFNEVFLIQMSTQESEASVLEVSQKINIETLNDESTGDKIVDRHSICTVTINCQKGFYIEPYRKCRPLGSFILINKETGATIAAGTVIGRTECT